MKHIETPRITLKMASKSAEKEKTEQQALVFLEQNFDLYSNTIMDFLREQKHLRSACNMQMTKRYKKGVKQ